MPLLRGTQSLLLLEAHVQLGLRGARRGILRLHLVGELEVRGNGTGLQGRVALGVLGL